MLACRASTQVVDTWMITRSRRLLSVESCASRFWRALQRFIVTSFIRGAVDSLSAMAPAKQMRSFAHGAFDLPLVARNRQSASTTRPSRSARIKGRLRISTSRRSCAASSRESTPTLYTDRVRRLTMTRSSKHRAAGTTAAQGAMQPTGSSCHRLRRIDAERRPHMLIRKSVERGAGTRRAPSRARSRCSAVPWTDQHSAAEIKKQFLESEESAGSIASTSRMSGAVARPTRQWPVVGNNSSTGRSTGSIRRDGNLISAFSSCAALLRSYRLVLTKRSTLAALRATDAHNTSTRSTARARTATGSGLLGYPQRRRL